jgi:hypothetical protein
MFAVVAPFLVLRFLLAFFTFHFVFPFFAGFFFGCLMFLSPGRVTGGFMLPLLVTMPMVVISASSIPGRRR